MKVYVVIQGDAKVSHCIDRFKICKSMKTAKEVVTEFMGDTEYFEEEQNGKKVWVTKETDTTSLDCMIYISERELLE